MFGTIIGGGMIGAISAGAGAMGGGGREDKHAVEGVQGGEGEASAQRRDEEMLRLLRGLDTKLDQFCTGLKRNTDEVSGCMAYRFNPHDWTTWQWADVSVSVDADGRGEEACAGGEGS